MDAPFPAPNEAADGGGPAAAVVRTPTYNAETFALEASAYMRFLRRAYRDRLQAGDDAGVLAIAQSAREVERATVVNASAATLSAVRGRVHDDPAAAADAAAARDYLHGAQLRLIAALRNRDIAALARCADAAEAAMHALAHPDDAFAEIKPMPSALPEDHQSVDVAPPPEADFDPFPQSSAKPRSSLLHPFYAFGMGDPPGYPGGAAPGARRRSGCCGFARELSVTDRVAVVVYLIMLVAALVAVSFITHQFVHGMRNPESFVRPRVDNSLPAPVVTLCLSQTGVPFSRLQVFNFTDAEGNIFRGADPQGGHDGRASPEFKQVVERFWHNPGGENCNAILGDFFPLPTASLNEIAAGTKVSRCQPCYRFGSRRQVIAKSTAFSDSSFIHAFTDNYFIECLKRPGGLKPQSKQFLHNLIEKIAKSEEKKLEKYGILARADGGDLSDLTAQNISSLDGAQLCNIFYFGFFPKDLKEMPETDRQIRYIFLANGTWINGGIGPLFVPPKPADDPFFPLESLQFFVSSNKSTVRNSLNGQRDMALMGPNTQTYASFKPLELGNTKRFDVETSTSNFIDSAVTPLFGYWLNYRIYYNYNRFITDVYYTEATYSFSQWLIDFTGYLSLFTGASVFSVLLLPILFSVRARQRAKMRAENPEAYVWKQHNKQFARRRFFQTPTTPANRSTADVKLPGYNVG